MQLMFLYITLNRRQTQTDSTAFSKPTTTDCIMPWDPCHTIHHTLAAIEHLGNRMNSFTLKFLDKQEEIFVIHNIL